MPKIPKSPSSGKSARRHNPLAEDYDPTAPQKQRPVKRRKHGDDEDEDGDRVVGTKASERILKAGQELVDEDEAEKVTKQPNPAFQFDARATDDIAQGDEVGEFDDEDAWGDEDDVEIEEIEVDPNDQEIFNRFYPSGDPDPAKLFDPSIPDSKDETNGGGTNLSALILEKIAEHEASGGGVKEVVEIERPESPSEEIPLDPKVIEVYTKVGQLLSRYRSGPLPKPFKILPSLSASEIPLLVGLTNPEQWTPHSVYAATRMFISSKPSVAQSFLNSILLPRVRDDIADGRSKGAKPLNDHLYNAIKRSLYKPACFFKGFLFPLVEDGECTVKEAEIISSVLSKVSIPVLHSAAALLRLCDIAAEHFTTMKEDGGGAATNIFIRVLLQKKYALPFKVVDALVFHFIRFKALNVGNGEAEDGDLAMSGTGANFGGRRFKTHKLPVRWHECLLAFAQRYRNDITEDQREALMDLVAAVGHKGKGAMGEEVRRELLAGRGRGVPVEAQAEPDGDDTMLEG